MFLCFYLASKYLEGQFYRVSNVPTHSALDHRISPLAQSLFLLVFLCTSFSLLLFISGTKAKCLAVSQIKGLLLPPRKRWNNKYGWRWNQPYLLLAPDSHICAASLSVSHADAAEAGEASAQCVPAPIAYESPGKQLTGTRTASQMMDPTRSIRCDRGRWGSGVATTEPEHEGLMWSAASPLCVCVCVHADAL